MRKVFPPNVPLITAFEIAGHIAHLNLRAAHMPYKHIIGQII